MNLMPGFNINATHIATILEDFDKDNSGELKCRIPVLMPIVAAGDPRETGVRLSTNSIINKEKTKIIASSTITLTNYININVPIWIRAMFDADLSAISNTVRKGKQIMITFVAGDINNIKVIGRYY